MFRGRHEHSLDEKGRLAIPTRYRTDLIAPGEEEGIVVLTNFDRCLSAYPLKEWEQLERKLVQLPQFDPKIQAFQRFLISGAVECTLDKAGRILIPANLRQYSGIDRDCVLVGQLNKFEIWSQDRWNNEFTAVSDQFSSLAASLSQLGIQL